MRLINPKGLNDADKKSLIQKLSEEVNAGRVILVMEQSYEQMLSCILLSVDRTDSRIDIIKDAGIPLGKLEKMTLRIAREVNRIRATKRAEGRKDEHKQGLKKDVLTEGQEMTQSFEQSKLPQADLSKAITRQ